MATNVRFITGDPFGEGQARSNRNLASQFALSEEERQSREAQGVDDAVRRSLQNVNYRPAATGQSISSIGTVTPSQTIRGPAGAGVAPSVARAPPSGIEGGGSPGFGAPMQPAPGGPSGVEGGGTAGFGAPMSPTTIEDIRPRSPLSRARILDTPEGPDTIGGRPGVASPETGGMVNPAGSLHPTEELGRQILDALTSPNQIVTGLGRVAGHIIDPTVPGMSMQDHTRLMDPSLGQGPPSTYNPTPPPLPPIQTPAAPRIPPRVGAPVSIGTIVPPPTQAPFGNPDPNPSQPYVAPGSVMSGAPSAGEASPPATGGRTPGPIASPAVQAFARPPQPATIDTVGPNITSIAPTDTRRPGTAPTPLQSTQTGAQLATPRPSPQPTIPSFGAGSVTPQAVLDYLHPPQPATIDTARPPIPSRPVAGVAPQESSPPSFGGGAPAPRAAATIAGGGAMQAAPGAATLPANGRPILQNPDGSISTERSITVTDPRLNGGRPTNIPSIWNGQQLDEDSAVQAALQSGQQFQSWGTIDEAVRAAVERSNMLGGQPQSTIDSVTPTPTGDHGIMSDASDGMGLGDRAQALPPTERRPTANNPWGLTTGQRGPGGGLMFRNWDNPTEGQPVVVAQLVRNADRIAASGAPVTAETLTRHPQFGWAAGDPRNVAYPATIAAHTGVPANQPLNLRDPRVQQQVLAAIVQQEGVSGGGGARAPSGAPATAAAAPSTIDSAAPRGVDWMSLARAAASVPGGAATALRLVQNADTGMRQDVQHRDAIEMTALTAAARGDVASARYWAQRGGINLPDAVLNDAQLARGLTIAERFYRDDHQQALQFAQAYSASGGNLENAWQAVGPPNSNPSVTFHDVRAQDDIVNLMITRRGGNVTTQEVGRGRAPAVISAEGAAERAQIGADAGIRRAEIAAEARRIHEDANRNPNSLAAIARAVATERAQAEGRSPTAEEVRDEYRNIRSSTDTLGPVRFAARFLDPADHLSRQVPQNIRSMRDGPEKTAAVQNWVRTVFLAGGAQANPVAAAAAAAPRPSQASAEPAQAGQRPTAAPTDGALGSRANPHQPHTDAEFEAIPVGQLFVNPADGRTLTKTR